jgi:hypothetical protein
MSERDRINALEQATGALARQVAGLPVRLADSAGTGPSGEDFPIVKIKNVSGLPKTVGSIVGYGVSLSPPPASFPRLPEFESAAPAVDKAFAILLADSAVNTTVDAAPVGVVATQVNLTDATHTWADVIANDYAKLASATAGPVRILWRQYQHILGSQTLGLQWALVELGRAASSTPEANRGVVYSIVSAASGFRDGPLTPGTGLVRLYTKPTGAAGTAWQPGATTLVETWMHASSATGKPVLLRESRKLPDGSPLYEIIAEGCATVPIQSG